MKGTISKKIFLITILFGIMISTALAIPAGPKNLTVVNNSRLVDFATQTHKAIAGNVTELTLDTWSVTRTWQGYYGTVTGTIVLANQDNQTMYDWNNANPNGRIYATRKVDVNWTGVRCADQTELNSENNFAGIVRVNGILPVDAPNLTFSNSTTFGTGADLKGNNNVTGIWANYSTFWVGPVQINGTADGIEDECFSAVMHNNATWEQSLGQNAQNDQLHWREVLLSDGTANENATIYTAILETDDEVGFDNRPHDFQMIVPENGHGTNVETTTYYFYIELE